MESMNEKYSVAAAATDAAIGEQGIVAKIAETLQGIRLALNCVLLGILIADLVVSHARRHTEKDGDSAR